MIEIGETIIKFPPLAEGILIKRYKRFLADVELADGEIVTATKKDETLASQPIISLPDLPTSLIDDSLFTITTQGDTAITNVNPHVRLNDVTVRLNGEYKANELGAVVIYFKRNGISDFEQSLLQVIMKNFNRTTLIDVRFNQLDQNDQLRFASDFNSHGVDIIVFRLAGRLLLRIIFFGIS